MQVTNGSFPIRYDKGPKPRIYGPVDGNIFAVMAVARKAIRGDMRQVDEGVKLALTREANEMIANEMVKRVTSSRSYEEALAIITEYVDFDFSWEDIGKD